MMAEFVIQGTLPGLNEYINAERRNRYTGAALKKRAQSIVAIYARSLDRWRPEKPVHMIYHWYEPNQRRDKDNISSFGRKVIQDALVQIGVLNDDGWKDISGFEDRFYVDRKNPRIVVELIEEEEG